MLSSVSLHILWGVFDFVSFGFHNQLRVSALYAWILESGLADLSLTATMSSKELFLALECTWSGW